MFALLELSLISEFVFNLLCTVRFVHAILNHIFHPYPCGTALLLGKLYIIAASRAVQPPGIVMEGTRFRFFWTIVGLYAHKNHWLLPYIVNCVIDVRGGEFSSILVGFQKNKEDVAKIA
ncbi:hypothetical protein PENSPDRAFT_671922 [Peniophora sp. CONT]|nr:hypothetical protein PENSPDRAFT_671922 [Peniophora sp. CONT]